MTKQTDKHMSVVIALLLLFFEYLPPLTRNAHSNQESHEAMMSADAYDDTILL